MPPISLSFESAEWSEHLTSFEGCLLESNSIASDTEAMFRMQTYRRLDRCKSSYNWMLCVYHGIEPMSKSVFNFRDFSYSCDPAFAFHLRRWTVAWLRCKFHNINPLGKWYRNRFDFKVVKSCKPPVFLTISMLFHSLDNVTRVHRNHTIYNAWIIEIWSGVEDTIRPISKQYKANATLYFELGHFQAIFIKSFAPSPTQSWRELVKMCQ